MSLKTFKLFSSSFRSNRSINDVLLTYSKFIGTVHEFTVFTKNYNQFTSVSLFLAGCYFASLSLLSDKNKNPIKCVNRQTCQKQVCYIKNSNTFCSSSWETRQVYGYNNFGIYEFYKYK